MGKLRKKLVKAFTLVELIVVMAIIAILAGVSIGSYIGITNKAKKTAALAEANQIRTQLYAIASENGGFKSGPLSGHSISFPDDINYFTAELLAASSLKKANGSTSYNPYLAFNFYSDEYQTKVDSSLNNYVRLGIGYLMAANNGNINTETVNKYANEVYVDTTDGTISSFNVVKDGTWATAGVNSEATSFSGTTPTVSTVAVSPTTTTNTTLEAGAAWTNWYANDNYTRFQTRLNAVSPLKDGSTTAFMKTTTFRIGTDNSVNLAPHVEAIANGSPISLSGLDKGATHESITCKYYLSTDLNNEISATDKATYFDATVDPAALGNIKLMAAAAGKSFVLTFQYGTGTNSSFPNVSYAFDAVEGYNINDVYDLFALNNCTNYYGVDEGDKESDRNKAIGNYLHLKGKDNAVTSATDAEGQAYYKLNNYRSGIFQKDIIIKDADIPSNFIWQTGETVTVNSDTKTVADSVVGSLKDESYLVLHRHSIAHPKFNIYGNYFKVSLSADFPKIASDSFIEPNLMIHPDGQEPDPIHTVESHSALFSDKQNQYLDNSGTPSGIADCYKDTTEAEKRFETVIQDIASTGNHSVSNVADTKHAGLSFYKAFGPSFVSNSLVNGYYIPVMNNGNADYVKTPVNPTMNVSYCRMFDSGNVAVFSYGGGRIIVDNSEIRKAGGPLAIAYCERYSLEYKHGSFNRFGTWIDFTNCELENWVTGQGGWFQIHKASEGIKDLMGFSSLLHPKTLPTGVTKARTFVKSDGKNDRINLIGITMGDSGESDGGFVGGVSIGGLDYINYEDGRSAIETALASNDATALGTLAKTTDYGLMYSQDNLIVNMGGADIVVPMFKTISSSGGTKTNHYAIVNGAASWQGVPSGDPDISFWTSQYMSIYYNIYANKPDNTFNNYANYSTYAGCDAYGILTEIVDF